MAQVVLDVEITAQIFEFGFKNNYLKYKDKWNNLKEFPVDFSFKKVEAKVQMSLGV